ncbi:MAG: hypothetical protein LAT68_14445 [Cyclobacteriaceae bacterium]|nr:hypothetical protein [Cyclobacteriaceae bacterium]MCH8517520.1 hypothetical protein [Cyclobacteriaceae bacterium]
MSDEVLGASNLLIDDKNIAAARSLIMQNPALYFFMEDRIFKDYLYLRLGEMNEAIEKVRNLYL